MIKPGQLNMIGIGATNVQADEDLRDIEPNRRKCFFEDEYPLKLHKTYSQLNCQLEKSLDYASKKVAENNSSFSQCIPWFYPIEDGNQLNMCDPWETKSFQEIMGTVPSTVYGECLPDCQGNIFVHFELNSFKCQQFNGFQLFNIDIFKHCQFGIVGRRSWRC